MRDSQLEKIKLAYLVAKVAKVAKIFYCYAFQNPLYYNYSGGGKMKEKTNGKQGIKEEEYLQNLFIMFYTLRHLWKLNEHMVEELYKILFPSKRTGKGNKTLYDKILRLEKSPSASDSTRLAALTGIGEGYFTGHYKLSVAGLTDKDWIEFIQLRRKKGTRQKDIALIQAESRIKSAIKKAKGDPLSQSETFKRLTYFSEYEHKRADKTLEDLFREIESKIAECKLGDFKQADIELLERHQKAIQAHLYHVAAMITLKSWETQK